MSFRAEKRVPASQLLRQAAAMGLAVVLTAGTLAPPLGAWEGRTHRLVTVRAIEALPYPLRDFFEENRPAITQLVANPAQWGEEAVRAENGFIRLDHYGRYPFADLPRDYNVAVRRFGRRKLIEQGTLPWQVGSYSLQPEAGGGLPRPAVGQGQALRRHPGLLRGRGPRPLQHHPELQRRALQPARGRFPLQPESGRALPAFLHHPARRRLQD